ncbi:MAG: nucleoside transporter C-terminal domain-containing protein, partial [Cyanobacteriota bacterium]
MERFVGIIGILIILCIAYAMSNNRKAIDKRLVIVGLLLQWCIAIFILKVEIGRQIFKALGDFISMLLAFSDQGAQFVFGVLAKPEYLSEVFGPNNQLIFAFKIAPTIIFVCSLVSILYYLGIMQKVVSVVAKIVFKLMNVSGAEALSNAASVFVGQVEAQIMIRPYVPGMTMSELLASMSGSMACIAGGVMAVYIAIGIPANYLLTASLMAIPGALVISKIVWPETEASETKGEVKLVVEKTDVNIVDAAAHGCSDGMKIAINVIAMLIGFLAIIAMIDWFLGQIGDGLAAFGLNAMPNILNLNNLTLSSILGVIFAPMAIVMGVPFSEAIHVGGLMGTKIIATEFVAYLELAPILKGIGAYTLSQKSLVISTFALCGFANIASVAMQIGGIGELAPTRKRDLARLGIKAL